MKVNRDLDGITISGESESITVNGIEYEVTFDLWLKGSTSGATREHGQEDSYEVGDLDLQKVFEVGESELIKVDDKTVIEKVENYIKENYEMWW